MNEEFTPDVIRLEQEEWQLGDRIASGGFAEVYLASSESAPSAVVKLIPQAPGAQREMLFEELNGVPNVVPVIDRGEWGNYWALAMPRAEKSLRDYLNEMGGQLAVADAVSVLADMAEALVAIEDRVVHRDIKPENVLLLNGRWCLADFGIARYAEATTAPDTMKYAKTPAYAAPEQWKDETATSETDVYALGVVAYELLTGERPFIGPEVHDYRRQHIEDPVKPMAGIPSWLQSWVAECLYKSAPARPTPQNLLTRLRTNMQAASPAAQRLQEANTLVVQHRAEAERQRSVAQEAAERQIELRKVADQSLERILGLLRRQIVDNAPSVQESYLPAGREWMLRAGILRINIVQTAKNSGFGLPFEVVAYTDISVDMPKVRELLGGYAGRSHSLWYCDAQQAGVFRWYETAFMRGIIGNSEGVVPFALSPDNQHAKWALSQGTNHTHQVAWPFTPIDQGDEESFIERWIGWFADAAEGRLQCPRNMPEKAPWGSWRQKP